ncbi:MAG: hypothetical protein AAGJ32_08175 [Pseudomonadota bacterium]
MDTDLGPINRRLREDARMREDASALLLERINEALTRLDEGRFGYCVVCEGEIEIARLMDDPAATKCRKCRSD